MKLSNATLAALPKTVHVPRYDRASLTPGIVHIGLGNFHRGHQAWYLHRLFDAGLNHDWAIIGAGVRATDAVMRDKLLAQDCLTTLIELDPSGKSVEVIGSMIGFVPVEDGNGPLIRQMADPAAPPVPRGAPRDLRAPRHGPEGTRPALHGRTQHAGPSRVHP